MILLAVSLVFVNLIFFGLLAIGSTSMATVEGVALPWLDILFSLWVCFHIPYVFYLITSYRNLKNEKQSIAVKRSVVFSAWLAFPGAVGLFILMGSKIVWLAAVIPLIQTLVAISVYLKNK